MSSNDTAPTGGFQALGLSTSVLRALEAVGYEQPSPIQAATIPPLLEGHDLLGQAQTGTGKTAAFALPVLSQIDTEQRLPQVLVLAPTRELAIQVAEAFQSYARSIKDFHVLPVYGGQSYDIQIRQLKRGVQVVVGTPGRVMDHMRKGTLKLDGLKTLVLDEADEMLRMGFIDDVEWILEQTPEQRQIALFSATMPREIKRVADRYLNNPKEVKIEQKTATAKTIHQRYWFVSGLHKLDAITRLLEVEQFDGMLIFVRTKTSTVELAEKLAARGHAAEALNGDIPQKLRERTVDRLKKGELDILVATDVVARGLDVERISHVVNYDIPHDTESYVHRIGRTGRAGRKGDAILFVAPREKRMLRAIEKATRQPIEEMYMPSAKDINIHRINRFKQRIQENMGADDLDFYFQLVEGFEQEQEIEPLKIAAALARMAQGDAPMLLKEQETKARRERDRDQRKKSDRKDDDRPPRQERTPSPDPRPLKDHPDVEMERFCVEVGRRDEVQPRNLVGAIANEAGLESEYIGQIDIYDNFSTVDLPVGMPKSVMRDLQKTWVQGRQLKLCRFDQFDPTKRADQDRREAKKKAKREARQEKGKNGNFKRGRKSGAKKQHRKSAGKASN
ncbi:MAG: DEAD/DEAH box helicase [Chromatiales bacterium]|nr:DEAD/DEAH box helicase [Chromatiales bacterium]